MKAANKLTLTALNDLVDSLDRQIDFAYGVVSAIRGLECENIAQHHGVVVLVQAHIKQLEKLNDELTPFLRVVPEQAAEATTATH